MKLGIFSNDGFTIIRPTKVAYSPVPLNRAYIVGQGTLQPTD